MRHIAIRNIYPNAVTIDDTAGAFDKDGNKIELDEVKIDTEIQRLVPIAKAKIIENKRRTSYMVESDPLFFKAQRGEATMEEWKAKVAEIKIRYPKE